MERLNVLIAEPDRALGDLYRTALERSGWDIEIVDAGHSVLSRVRTLPPDVLLVNSLPDIDAFTVVEQVRAHYSADEMIIVVLLDSVDHLDVEQVKNLDVQAWLSKTRITREKLSETIAGLLETRSRGNNETLPA